MRLSIPIMQIRNNAVLVYDQQQNTRPKRSNDFRANNMREQRGKRYNGILTPGSKKRLSKAVTLLCQSAKKTWIYNEVSKKQHLHKLSFIK